MNLDNCDCSGTNANIINKLMQNPNNSINSNMNSMPNVNMPNVNMPNVNNMQNVNSMNLNNMNDLNMLSSGGSMLNHSDNLNNFGSVGNMTNSTNNNSKSMTINAIRNIANSANVSTNNNNNNNNNNNKNKINPYLRHATKNISNDISQILNQTYISSLNYIIIGFMLASALAWNEAVKFFIGRSIRFNKGNPMYYIYYAISLTVFSALVYTFTKKYINNKVKDPNIMYAVTA